MSSSAWTQLAAFLVVLLVLARPLATWIHAAMEGRVAWLLRVERPLLRAAGVGGAEQGWLRYSLGLLLFNGLGVIAVYALQRLQAQLPLNPQDFAAVSPDSAFNTAISFVTNTNWQGYGGETTMSHLTQMMGLTVQNFLSAATGLAVVMALLRGFARRSAGTLGNVWADLTRATLWVLLPLSLAFAVMLAGLGVVQTLAAAVPATTLEGVQHSISLGPVASQLAIKMLGTNGGGFFNANSAHPFENPTALTNALQMLAIFLIPTALCFVMGRQVGDIRQGWALLAAMAVMFVVAVVIATGAEQAGNPRLAALGVDATASATQPGGNMEGKEARFGINASSLFAVITTAASCGAVNAMHDSFTPLGGAVPLVMMQLGEVVFGGVGAGLYGMLVFALLAVFVAGLMIGRTPEYLGKKIEAVDMKMVSLAILLTPLAVLVGTAVAVATEPGRVGIAAPGAHGFSEVLYAFSSAGNNNGSAFAGLSANTPFYNLLLGLVMWVGRFGVIVPVLALAGSLAGKKRLVAGEGSLPTHGPLFVALLIGVVLLVGLLNYVPALALGPVVEHLILWSAA
ncbi:potassium-transporting ATPase subunit KdpA [Roseateles sp. LKC17W]|uniref:Potassium-transporting ATPase potassium-binding subunit n=1 Tax=Pelomonas margarita TaxID=3299031 RepID=A0ABW7FGD5_9BURK